MQGNKIDFASIIRVIRREFAKVREDELVHSNLAKLDYLEGVMIGLIKFLRDIYQEDLKKYKNEEN